MKHRWGGRGARVQEVSEENEDGDHRDRKEVAGAFKKPGCQGLVIG